jgi:type I restriction enzyme S subunit
LCGFPILKVGNNDLYKQWVSTTKDIFDKQLLLTKEIAVLTKQRDELLPLLMNGQISVMQPVVNCDLVMTIIVCQK